MAVDGDLPLGQSELHDLDHVKDVSQGAYIEVLPRKVVEEHWKTLRKKIRSRAHGLPFCYALPDRNTDEYSHMCLPVDIQYDTVQQTYDVQKSSGLGVQYHAKIIRQC